MAVPEISPAGNGRIALTVGKRARIVCTLEEAHELARKLLTLTGEDTEALARVSRLLSEHDGGELDWDENAGGERDYCDERARELIAAYHGTSS